MGQLRHSSLARGMFVAAMLLALLVRLLVPVGYMPTAIGGTPQIQLCDGQHSVTLDFNKTSPDRHKAAEAPCLFSGGYAGGLIASVHPVPNLPMPLISPWPAVAAIADLTVHRLAAPPPPAQGPPAQA